MAEILEKVLLSLFCLVREPWNSWGWGTADWGVGKALVYGVVSLDLNQGIFPASAYLLRTALCNSPPAPLHKQASALRPPPSNPVLSSLAPGPSVPWTFQPLSCRACPSTLQVILLRICSDVGSLVTCEAWSVLLPSQDREPGRCTRGQLSLRPGLVSLLLPSWHLDVSILSLPLHNALAPPPLPPSLSLSLFLHVPPCYWASV